jgi:hypothetical protein
MVEAEAVLHPGHIPGIGGSFSKWLVVEPELRLLPSPTGHHPLLTGGNCHGPGSAKQQL